MGNIYVGSQQVYSQKRKLPDITIASVTLKVSNVLNYYFLNDISIPIEAYAGKYPYLTLTDTGGKAKKVLLGVVGTGETLSSELLTNGNMETGDPPTGWTFNTSTGSSAADERTGGAGAASMNILSDGTVSQHYCAGKAIVLPSGALCSWSAWGKVVDGTNIQFRYSGYGFLQPTITSTSWTNISGKFTSTSANGNAQVYMQGANKNVRCDDISYKQILTPSATGIWFTPVSEDAGWNPSSANFTTLFTRS